MLRVSNSNGMDGGEDEAGAVMVGTMMIASLITLNPNPQTPRNTAPIES